jgi:hypothetical protein
VATLSIRGKTMGKWIDVQKDGHPDDVGEYLCVFNDGDIEIFTFDWTEFHDGVWGVPPYRKNPGSHVTHWQELPPPPTVDNNKDKE